MSNSLIQTKIAPHTIPGKNVIMSGIPSLRTSSLNLAQNVNTCFWTASIPRHTPIVWPATTQVWPATTQAWPATTQAWPATTQGWKPQSTGALSADNRITLILIAILILAALDLIFIR